MSAYGQNAVVAISFQDSAGTANISSLHFIPFISESIALLKEPLISENNRGIFDESADYEGANTIEGDIETEAQSIALGAMLKTVFGEPTTTAVGSVFQHVYTPTTSDFSQKLAKIPVTIYKHLTDSGSAHLFYDLNGSSVELSCSAGEFLGAMVSFVGGKEQQNAAVAASYPIERHFAWDVASVQIAPNSGDVLSAVDQFMDFSIVMNDNLEAQHTLSATKTPSRIKRTEWRTVEINGTMKYDNQDEYQRFKDQQERAMQIYFEGPVEVGSGHKESLKIEIPALRYREFPIVVDGAGPIEVGFTAAGKFHTGSGTAITITLVNTQDAY